MCPNSSVVWRSLTRPLLQPLPNSTTSTVHLFLLPLQTTCPFDCDKMTHQQLVNEQEDLARPRPHPNQRVGRAQLVLSFILLMMFVGLWTGYFPSLPSTTSPNSSATAHSNSRLIYQHFDISIHVDSASKPIVQSLNIKNPKFFASVLNELDVEESADLCVLDTNDRFDCDPLQNADEEACYQRGCCWQPTTLTRSKIILCKCLSSACIA
jgi:hypothetical protein